VYVRFGNHRVQESDVVGAGTNMRNKVTDPFGRLSILLPAPGAFHDRARIALEKLDLFARIKFLAMALQEFRFVIERVALAGGSGHEELNNPFGARAMVQTAVEFSERTLSVRE
jgi:hypothetical protein